MKLKSLSILIKALFFILFAFIVRESTAQTTPFTKGVNLASWFQAGSAQGVQFTKYTRTDFENIQSLGCDVIRIPINLHGMTNGAPDYEPDPLFLFFFDEILDWAEDLEMYVILDNHSSTGVGATDPNVGIILNKVWEQIADHFKDRSEYLMYEILNEPNNIDEALWGTIQGEAIDAIRGTGDTHTIIVGGASWNSFYTLTGLPQYSDDNLIYTFHFYDPFLLTHQGASWVVPSMEPLVNVPFPYDANQMPSMPSSFAGTWLQTLYNNYSQDGTAQKLKELMDIAIQFRDDRNVPIFCGEFGVFIPNSNNDDRVNWHEEVAGYLEQNNIARTLWDYEGGFGIFEPDGSLFDHHLNIPLLEAMGFNTPPQTPYVIQPDQVGFPVYRDFTEEGFDAFGSGALNYYSDDQPSDGQFAIHWTGATQYQNIGWTFQPKKDLTFLLGEEYALELMVKTDDSNGQLDIRFLDSKLDTNDRPWRSRITINGSDYADGDWHRIYVPLSDFQEQGSWDDNMWFNPQGLFDWGDIEKLEIVAEHGNMGSANWYFDEIYVINENILNIENAKPSFSFKISPNPVSDLIVIEGITTENLIFQIVDVNGRIFQSGIVPATKQLNLAELGNGVYWLYLENEEGGFGIEKLIKTKD